MSDYTYKAHEIQPFLNQNGKVIGILKNGVLSKKVKGSIHMLRQPKAWAWDRDIVERAQKAGGRYSEITDSETNIKYRSELSDFFVHGVPINRGYGEQIALPLIYWSTDNHESKQMRLF